MTAHLLQPIRLNETITLKNRIIMAPLTRCFADDDLVPTQQMADYYAKRADVGLIISEATLIDPVAQGYPNTPGIYNQAHIAGWQKVTSAVHEKGGKIFCQLWHCGRVAHSSYTGQKPVAPSTASWHGRVPRTNDLDYEVPRALSSKEVKKTIKAYIRAAKNAIKAGFDGVEIHGANGYLIEQFMRQETNNRTDQFGGCAKKRLRFAWQIIDGISEAIGPEKTAIRLSPQAYAHIGYTKGDEKAYKKLFKKLNKRGICYVHLGAFSDEHTFDYLKGGSASEYIRRYYKGHFITCGSYGLEQADRSVAEHKSDMVAIGRPLIANPDFMQRITQGKTLIEYDAQMLKSLI